jgi:UDP-2,3-diacylglucosamine hydrolase
LPKEIRENALFIADAHYPHHGDHFLKILKALEEKSIQTPQLFLMGDIFDLLFGHNEYIKTFSKEAIEALQKLSQTIEIFYIEGNHDFCLQEIFPHISVYKREEQPVHFRLNNHDIYLSHGDKYTAGILYNLYSKLLRNRSTLTLLKPFEKKIINHRMEKLKRKKICGDFKEYKKRFNKIISKYPKNSTIIEGHFHQALIYKNYISLPSLACQGEVGIIKEGNVIFMKL